MSHIHAYIVSQRNALRSEWPFIIIILFRCLPHVHTYIISLATGQPSIYGIPFLMAFCFAQLLSALCMATATIACLYSKKALLCIRYQPPDSLLGKFSNLCCHWHRHLNHSLGAHYNHPHQSLTHVLHTPLQSCTTVQAHTCTLQSPPPSHGLVL